MSYKEILTLVFTFLGGGFASTIVTWLSGRSIEKRKKKIDALRNQIDNLYGKLYFWVGQNQICFNHYRQYHRAYDEEFVGKKWSGNDITHKRVEEGAKKTIDKANEFIDKVVENNEIIIKIIQDNYSYIDLDDIEIFQRFILDYLRIKIEHKEEDYTIPFRIASNLEKTVGSPSYMKPEFIQRVEDKFKSKRKKLDELLKYKFFIK